MLVVETASAVEIAAEASVVAACTDTECWSAAVAVETPKRWPFVAAAG